MVVAQLRIVPVSKFKEILRMISHFVGIISYSSTILSYADQFFTTFRVLNKFLQIIAYFSPPIVVTNVGMV